MYENLAQDAPKNHFTIGIVDDVTNTSLAEKDDAPNTAAEGTIEVKFWGLGGDGTVGANKNCDHQPPALRRQAHQEPLLYQQG